jgi:hypothetical protein
METKQYITLEVKKNDFTFAFQMQHGATWGSAIDSAFEILQKLNELSQQSIQAMKPVATEPEIVAVEPEVVGE